MEVGDIFRLARVPYIIKEMRINKINYSSDSSYISDSSEVSSSNESSHTNSHGNTDSDNVTRVTWIIDFIDSHFQISPGPLHNKGNANQ